MIALIEKMKNIFKVTEDKKMVCFDLAVITAVVSIVVLIAYKMIGIYPFGEESIARGDMVQQTIPAGMYYIWDVLHGDASPFFTWNSGFGMNISGASSLGALLSPLNLFLYFTARENIADFVNIILILKMIGIAFSMYFYLRKYNVKRYIHIIGGVLYAFGAASLVHFQIILVMDAAFLLPLIMIGIERIFEKKGCKFFIVMFALSLVVNVYTGGMILIFLFLSCGVRLFLGTKEHKERRRCALWLGISVGVAVLLSAAVNIPALISIRDSARSGDGNYINTYMTAIQSTWNISEWKTVERMFINVSLPLACIAVFMLRGNASLAVRIKKYRTHIILLTLMVVSFIVPGIELLWHGGSRACWPIRFVFVISFVIIDFAVALIKDNKEKFIIKTKSAIHTIVYVSGVALALLGGFVFYRFYEQYCQNEIYAEWGDGFLCIFIELLFLGVYIFLLNMKKKAIFFVFLCVELTCTSIVSFAPNKDNITVFSPTNLEASSNVDKSMDTEINDFERIKNTDYKVDQIEYSLVLGEEAVSNYWHVISPMLQPNFAALGYTINWSQLLDTGGTIFSDTLLQNKYYLSQEDMPADLYEHCEAVKGEDKESLQLFKNKFSLPFVVDTDVEALDLQAEKFATQNSLFAAVTGSDEQLISDLSAQINNSSFDMDVSEEKKILYFYGTNTTSDPINILVNGTALNLASSSDPNNVQYPTDFCNGIVCLGVFQNEHVNIQFVNSMNASSLHVGIMDYNTFVNGIEKIKNQNAKITKLKQKNSGVKIELENETKGNAFLPVSYDEGWTCRVNGETVSKVSNFAGMISIPVVKGDNSIELTYVAPGRRVGQIISVLTILAMIAFTVLNRKKPKLVEKTSDVLGYVAYAVFAMAFIAFIIIVFVIPIGFYLRKIFIDMEAS